MCEERLGLEEHHLCAALSVDQSTCVSILLIAGTAPPATIPPLAAETSPPAASRASQAVDASAVPSDLLHAVADRSLSVSVAAYQQS